MTKGVFFKKSIKSSNDVLENKEYEIKEEEKQIGNLRDTIIMDRNITKYIIDNFPEIALDIRDSLINFADTLENTIDFIEDKSSNLIKDSRNFKLSQDYRDKSMEIYEVVQRINNYVEWINTSYEEVTSKEEEGNLKEKSKQKIENKQKMECKEKEIDAGGDNKLCIYQDFTSKSPKAFKIDKYYLEVSDWKELTVKAADILTKNYKNKKNKYKQISVDDVVLKESVENDFRDSVIDILKIYGVPLNKFYVYVD